MDVVPAFGVGHVDDVWPQQAEKVDPHLAVGDPIIFLRDHRSVKDRLTSCEIKLVSLDVQQALRFIPGDLALSVSTTNCLR